MRSRALPGFSQRETADMVGDGVAKLVERAFAARGRLPDPEAVDCLSARHGAHAAGESRPYPGVVSGLRALTDDGWRLGVCTNKPEAAARALLAALGLDSCFGAIGGGDSFPERKPDPRHLLATLEAVGGCHQRAVMGGDHANDVAGASGAGLPCISAAWAYGPPEMAQGAAAVAQDFTELMAIARRLLG